MGWVPTLCARQMWTPIRQQTMDLPKATTARRVSAMSCAAEAQKRAAGSSSRALAGHSVVPAAMLVDETPTLAHFMAAPIVTVSASRMAAAGGSQGKLVRPVCIRLLFSPPRRFHCCDGLLTLQLGSTLFLLLSLHPATCTILQVPELSPTKY